jgi:hypothetical protein
MPCRLGCPSGIRGIDRFAAAGAAVFAGAWPSTGAAVSAAIAAIPAAATIAL